MSYPVIVNVYDMNQANKFLYPIGLGIFHSGVEILGTEYCFGGHDHGDATGVFQVTPKVGPPGVQYRESISMGSSLLSLSAIQALISKLSLIYTGRSYHILNRNCNHFTDDFVFRLTGQHIPSWINRLAKLGNRMPWLCLCGWNTIEEEQANERERLVGEERDDSCEDDQNIKDLLVQSNLI